MEFDIWNLVLKNKKKVVSPKSGYHLFYFIPVKWYLTLKLSFFNKKTLIIYHTFGAQFENYTQNINIMSIYRLLIPFLVAAIAASPLIAQLEFQKVDSVIYKGVDFIESSEWGEVLALAELEDKIIFLDAYTSWCRPCKKMDKVVFSRPDVGDLYNENFLNVKVNMEKGDGVNLVEKYHIIAYPSLFFLSPDGEVVHRVTGYKGPGEILKIGRQVKEGNKTVASLEEQYKTGERTPEFLYEYLQTSIEAKDGRQTARLEEYLSSQEDWQTEDIRSLLFHTLDTPDSPLFDHLIENKSAFAIQFGVSDVENKIQNLVYTAIRKSEVPLETAPLLFERAYPDKAAKFTQQFKLNHYRDQEDGVNYAKEIGSYLATNPQLSEDMLNEVAWNYYDLVADQNQVKSLLKSAKIAKKKSNTYLNNESLALLYAKAGKTKKAKKFIKKAIGIAQANKMSAASSEDLLAELSGN